MRKRPGKIPQEAGFLVFLTLVVAVVVAYLGKISGPAWDPHPNRVTLTLDSPSVDVTGGQGQTVQRPEVGGYETRKTQLTIDLGEVEIPAWLIAPIEAPPGPGVVFIHGAGTVEPDAFGAQVEALASSGIRALVPTKRLDNYSVRQRDYVSMADDYLKSWKALREVPGVDPDQVGFYGESEGAWIAPVAASIEPSVSFLILASAAGVSPREQAAYAATTYLHNTHVPKELFRSIPRALGMQIPGGGFEYADFDVHPYLKRVHQPVLMLYGTGDDSMPVVQGAQFTAESLKAGNNDRLTVRYFDQADHGLKVGEEVVDGVGEVLTDWVWGLPETATPQYQYGGSQPQQLFSADPVPQAPWFASGNFLVSSILGAIGAGVVGISLCVRRLRHACQERHVYLAGIATVVASWVPIVVFLGYIYQIAELAVNYELNDLLVWAGWFGVQAAGIFGVGIAVISLSRVYQEIRSVRLRSPMGLVALGACHTGAFTMLVIGSYWGIFPALG